MSKIGIDLPTFYAPPQRESQDIIFGMTQDIQNDPMLAWFHAVPMGTAIINQDRQILFCNEVFLKLSLKNDPMEIQGLRPGEALGCINAQTMEAGCGCSEFCNVCGAANAIVKSLNGEGDCQECRLIRQVQGVEVSLDLQVFTQPINYNGESLAILFTMDISHEKRLKYLNRTFYHGLINSVGGISILTELIEAEPEDSALFGLLIDSSRRTLKEVLYHRDLEAAENGRLTVDIETFDAAEYLDKFIGDECKLKNTQPNCAEVNVTCPSLTSDKRILGHVLRNMLSNAIEALTKSSKGNISLTCSRLSDGSTAITMSNPGAIPDNIQRQMFKRYVSTKSHDRGLGTYVIKLFTERYLGGTVSFQSKNGTTTFQVILPAKGQEH